LLIDHRSGLFKTVKDIDQRDLRNNVIALAKTAKTFNIPMIATSSVPNGPNGAQYLKFMKYYGTHLISLRMVKLMLGKKMNL